MRALEIEEVLKGNLCKLRRTEIHSGCGHWERRRGRGRAWLPGEETPWRGQDVGSLSLLVGPRASGIMNNSLIVTKVLESPHYIMPIFKMSLLRLGGSNRIAILHNADRWLSRDLNPVLPDSEGHCK